MGSSPTRGSSFFLGKVTALGVLCCFALFVCLTLLASFFLPFHLSFKNMYIHYTLACYCNMLHCIYMYTCITYYFSLPLTVHGSGRSASWHGLVPHAVSAPSRLHRTPSPLPRLRQLSRHCKQHGQQDYRAHTQRAPATCSHR